MPELTEEINKLQEEIKNITILASAIKTQHPACTGTWWQIENVSLPILQYYADQAGQKLDWDANRGRFRMQASDWREGMTLFIFSTPVKARMVYVNADACEYCGKTLDGEVCHNVECIVNYEAA